MGKDRQSGHSCRIVGRRRLMASGACSFLLVALTARANPSGNVNVESWHLPRLAFTMTGADTGQMVTAHDFLGKLVLLYFGYTHCPDVCPLTLHNVAQILQRLGENAEGVRVLFVTVDPNRDTLPVLRRYTHLFAPEIVGLRGTADQLAALARAYHLGYSVTPATASHPYEVTHSSAVYVFDKTGRARLLIPSLASTTPDIAGTASDLEHILHSGTGGLLARLGQLL